MRKLLRFDTILLFPLLLLLLMFPAFFQSSSAHPNPVAAAIPENGL